MKAHIQAILSRVQADYVEIRIEESFATSINFTGPDLEECSANVDFGGNVRALVRGGWVFTTFNSLDDLEKKVELAIAHARSIGERRGEDLQLAPVPVVDVEIPYQVLNDPAAVPLSRKLEIIKGYNDMILGFDKRITTSVSRYADKKRKVCFANSQGSWVSREFCDLSISCGAVVRSKSGAFSGRGYNGSSNDFNVILGLEDDI